MTTVVIIRRIDVNACEMTIGTYSNGICLIGTQTQKVLGTPQISSTGLEAALPEDDSGLELTF